MTAQRQHRHHKAYCSLFRPAIALIAVLAAGGWPSGVIRASTTERIVVDHSSGLAIGGFDPVAYFVDSRPVLGMEQFEAWERGAVWRFHNEGNRASFLAHPDIYGPQFGGYDPVDVARGVTVAGNPMFWIVADQQLFLFSREASRDAFALDPERYLRPAMSRWPTLEYQLSR